MENGTKEKEKVKEENEEGGKGEDLDEMFEAIAMKVADGYLGLGISVGKKLGLFNVMVGLDTYKTSQEIADEGGWKERYYINSLSSDY